MDRTRREPEADGSFSTRAFHAASFLIASAVVGAVPLWFADARGWSRGTAGAGVAVSGALYLGAAAIAGAVLVTAAGATRALGRLLGSRAARLGIALQSVGIATLAMHQVWTALRPASARPFLLGVACTVGMALVAASMSEAGTELMGLHRSRGGARAVVPSALAAVGVGLLVLDRAIGAHAAERAYSFLEGAAHVAFSLVAACAGRRLGARTPRGRIALATAASVSIFWAAAVVVSPAIRDELVRRLCAAPDRPLLVARWLDRLRHIGGPTHPSVARIAAKYPLPPRLDLDDAWRTPHAHEESAASAREQRPSTVIVFFVDTLRADAAADPELMPETVSWTQESVSFSRAYSTGSSTLLALGPMLGCRYDAGVNDRPLLLDLARAAGMTSMLVIPRGAADYHRGAYPSFRFDENVVVDDVARGRIPTADAVVDHALGWLETRRSHRSFLWLYQFDVHGWGDIDPDYVDANRGKIASEEGGEAWRRYRATVRGIDRAFARLRRGLTRLGLDDAVVVFVSDHGEALGHEGFWFHSTYLWEPLIRVPFAFHAPGQRPRTLHEPVSTVDLVPTIARFLAPLPAGRACHGEDLLARGSEPRRLPILFSAAAEGYPVRSGLLVAPDRKLVVDVRTGDARLLALGPFGIGETELDVPVDELARHVTTLVRAPTYPRE